MKQRLGMCHSVEKMLMTFARPEARYFSHFKGNLYRLERTAYDSETQERMVVYQQEYGEPQLLGAPRKRCSSSTSPAAAEPSAAS